MFLIKKLLKSTLSLETVFFLNCLFESSTFVYRYFGRHSVTYNEYRNINMKDICIYTYWLENSKFYVQLKMALLFLTH